MCASACRNCTRAPGISAHHTPQLLPAGTLAPAREKTTLVVFSGDLDKVMAALIIASGALATGKPVSLFFTFWGLNVLRREAPVPVSKTFIERAFGFMLPRGAGRLNSISKLNFGGAGTRSVTICR